MDTVKLGNGGGSEYFRGRGKTVLSLDEILNYYIPLILKGLPVAKAPTQNMSDGEERKLGERTGLDTPVVPAVNDADCGVTLS